MSDTTRRGFLGLVAGLPIIRRLTRPASSAEAFSVANHVVDVKYIPMDWDISDLEARLPGLKDWSAEFVFDEYKPGVEST